MSLALGLGLAYLVGAVPVGFLVARLFGVADIRRWGSGNIGATNVLRVAGRAAAAVTLAADVLKGYLATLAGVAAAAPEPAAVPALTAGCALAAVVGNCWPVFLRFRGGKGVATGLGALLRLAPLATLPAAAVWVAVTAMFRYVSLGSLTAAACVPVGALLLGEPGVVVGGTAAVALLVVLRHHANIARLLAGREPRLGTRATSA